MRLQKKTLLYLLPLLFYFSALSALLSGPGVYFTNNVKSTAVSTDITEMEQHLLDQINGATTSIDLAIYDFNRASVRDALIAAHQRGVTVRVVTDDEASEHNSTYKPFYDALRDAGIAIIDDNRPSDIMHNKFFIFDGQRVWTGSTNITDNGFTRNHNNSLLFEAGDVATIFSEQFSQMFDEGKFSTSKSASSITAVTYNSLPLEIYFSPKDNALDEVIAEVNAAEESIYFSIFFFTSDDLRDALIAAHNRGVTIRGVWDLLGASNFYSDDEALCDAGIPIKIEDFSGKMHNKFMIIDVQGALPRIVSGSMNWTNNGANKNDENTVILHDATSAQSFKTFWDSLYDALDDSTLCIPEPTAFLLYLPSIIQSGTPPPPEPEIKIRSILYNPDGEDAAGEVVIIDNIGNAPQVMSGWVLFDESDTRYTFPDFTLDARQSVTVWVTTGLDDASNLFWNRSSPVWNNNGDTATLINDRGEAVDSCSYSGGEEGIICP